MGTRPAPHAGIGVAQYAWSSSPLRRYVDLVNQWQIIACARHGRTAALAAPFKPKDVSLLAIIADFDASYAAYNGFQASIERYWALQYLAQNEIHELDATTLKEGLVRADTLPLVFRAAGAESLPRGAGVRVRVGTADLLTLDLAASVVARRTEAPAAAAAAEAETIEGDDEADAVAGPLALAIDVEGGTEAEDVTDKAPA
jgi:exoribonuclease-2